jgi:quercetin 2,3-dioxygenase
MKKVFHPANERGTANFGWLQARQSFSFGQWYDPKKVHFGALRVLNDDIIQGGGGFPTHPHDNMEIVTIPLTGALAHKDSTGGEGVITAGDVQIMSAGTGVRHSEYNASATETASLLQIWLFPKEENIKPRYDQKTFDTAARKNKWQVVVSPDAADGGMWINQDARFSLARLDPGATIHYENKFAGNGMYVFLLEGSITVEDSEVNKRDALGVYETDSIEIKAQQASEVLLIEIPMLPDGLN